MRTLVISILVFLIASISLIPASGQSAEVSPSEQQIEESEYTDTTAIGVADDPNVEETADSNAADEPNNAVPTVEDFDGLENELRQIDKQGSDEIRLWTRRTENRLELVLAVQQQITTELDFLRQLAIEEGAVKTTVAIDRILSDRQVRYKDIIERFEREQERLRREEERGRADNRERGRDRRRSR